MGNNAKKLFCFNRDLPVPFEKMKGKKIGVSSTYGDGTEATISTTMCKAILAYCKCKDGSGEGAVGMLDHKAVAEYKSSESTDLYHLVVLDPSVGSVLASVYDKNTEATELYTISNKARDGAALGFAMMPLLMADAEFKEKFTDLYGEYAGGFSDIGVAAELMAILCDNAYRRVVDDSCAAHIEINIEATGNLMRVSNTHLDSGSFAPNAVDAGEFTIFATSAAAPVIATPNAAIAHASFTGKYALTPGRTLTMAEQSLVPVLEPWYILPPEIVSICKHAQVSTEKSAPMRNFLLRGPAGTGKTKGAEAIAAGLGLPYTKYTCSANSEIYDFVGQVFPETGAVSTGNDKLDEERQQLMDMGGITYANVAALLKLPDVDTIDFDPEGAYKGLTGKEKAGATTQECMAIVMETAADKIQQLSQRKPDDGQSQSGQSYTYIETDFIRALKHGWVCEIQEPSTIMQPGVLVGLNSLLEQSGSITLPTGETIRRHPDAVVVVTTNISYEGCRGMNQSVIDRMSLIQDVEMPSAEIMAQRAMSITGCEDDVLVGKMVTVVNDLAEYCRSNGIGDGSYGMRSLIDWIISAEITGNPYTSALYTVISKATADEEDRQSLITTVLEPQFARKGRKKKAS